MRRCHAAPPLIAGSRFFAALIRFFAMLAPLPLIAAAADYRCA